MEEKGILLMPAMSDSHCMLLISYTRKLFRCLIEKFMSPIEIQVLSKCITTQNVLLHLIKSTKYNKCIKKEYIL